MVDKTPSDLNMEIFAWVSRERSFGHKERRCGRDWARVDTPELQAAIINLIVNARDTMPEGSEIGVTCAGVDVADTIRMP
jgi:hypothetical protein